MMIGYDPDFDAESKSIFREEFVRVLMEYPQWAVHKAFDDWMRTMTRRPSPAEIVILIGRAREPLFDELARRRREEDRADAAQRESARADEITPEILAQRRAAAADIMRWFGYTHAMPATGGPRRVDIDAGEIEATMTAVNANAAYRADEAKRRAGVAEFLEKNGLGDKSE